MKLSFRARALDASKALPIYRDTEIPDTADCSSINRTVPQMPTGMEKEEESEHHLQQAICTGTTIPTPEVFSINDLSMYDSMYPPDYKTPRQLIYMQPFSMEADIPDYDMDSDDEVWISGQSGKLELTPDKFEEMMDRLEKGSGQTVVTLQEAKALIKEDDDLIIAVYDYWLTKRLKTQHHLIPQVRTEARHGISNHNPYIAFRRRTEKMQTRKNRKNDESSYEKMLKLRRDLARAVTLLEMVKKREKSKLEHLHLSIEVFEKRYQAGDFSGQIVNDALSQRPSRPAFTQLYQGNHLPWSKDNPILASLTRKEKRQYKKRRHKSASKPTPTGSATGLVVGPTTSSQSLDFVDGEVPSSDDEVVKPLSDPDEDAEGPFPFRRRLNCLYNLATDSVRSPPSSTLEDGTGDKLNFFPASTKLFGHNHFIGSARRRIGRGGRVVIDRQSRENDNFWRSIGFDIFDSGSHREQNESLLGENYTLGHHPIKREVAPPRIIDIVGKPLPQNFMQRNVHKGPSSASASIASCSTSCPSRSQIASISPLRNVQNKGNDGESSPSPPKLAAYMGTVCAKEDEDLMLFEVANLVDEPDPGTHFEPHDPPFTHFDIDTLPYSNFDSKDPPYFLKGDIDAPVAETTLLSKSSADLLNMQIISQRTTDSEWYEFPDLTVASEPPNDFTESDSDDGNWCGDGETTVIEKVAVQVKQDKEFGEADVSGKGSSKVVRSFGIITEKIQKNTDSNSTSTVSINVLLSPDSYVKHCKINGEPMDDSSSNGRINDEITDCTVKQNSANTIFTSDKFHHNGETLMDLEEGQGSEPNVPEVLSVKPLPLSPAPQNGVTYLREQFVSDCGDKTQRFKNLVYCPEIGI